MNKKLIILTDCGDTIIDEGSEVYGTTAETREIVQSADCIPGMKEAMLELYSQGYTIALVADGRVRSFHNILGQNGLLPIFRAEVISETYATAKPDILMFQKAFEKLGLREEDKKRTIMIGNNLKRDVLGANRFGIISVLLTWSPRYDMDPDNAAETPAYRVANASEFLELVDRLEAAL